jgi:hypothetical protein
MSEVRFYQNTQDQTQLIIPLACQSGRPRLLIRRGFSESYASSDGRSAAPSRALFPRGKASRGHCADTRFRKTATASLMTSRHFRKCSSYISWRGTPGSKKTWPISSSTQPKNGLRGCCCCWPILERKAERSPFSQRSVRRHSLR